MEIVSYLQNILRLNKNKCYEKFFIEPERVENLPGTIFIYHNHFKHSKKNFQEKQSSICRFVALVIINNYLLKMTFFSHLFPINFFYYNKYQKFGQVYHL